MPPIRPGSHDSPRGRRRDPTPISSGRDSPSGFRDREHPRIPAARHRRRRPGAQAVHEGGRGLGSAADEDAGRPRTHALDRVPPVLGGPGEHRPQGDTPARGPRIIAVVIRARSHPSTNSGPAPGTRSVSSSSSFRIRSTSTSTTRNRWVEVPETVPVYVLYPTVAVEDGRTFFFDDIYGYDTLLAFALEKRYAGWRTVVRGHMAWRIVAAGVARGRCPPAASEG